MSNCDSFPTYPMPADNQMITLPKMNFQIDKRKRGKNGRNLEYTQSERIILNEEESFFSLLVKNHSLQPEIKSTKFAKFFGVSLLGQN